MGRVKGYDICELQLNGLHAVVVHLTKFIKTSVSGKYGHQLQFVSQFVT